MAPKKNAFFVFVTEYKKEQMTDQNKSLNFKQLADKLTPVWTSMSDGEKNKYKILADKFNSEQEESKMEQPEQIINLYNNSSYYYTIQKCIENMFELIADNEELIHKKFILLHVNCHTHEAEQYYFPAEIAALEFNLSKGVLRTYHQIVGLSNNYPRGFAGGMRLYSDRFHQISCWEKHPDDYEKILLDFLKFLKGSEHCALNYSALDLPYIFTIETEVGMNMMKTKSSLERLYQKVFPEYDPLKCKPIFKIGSVERLLFEIKKKTNMHLDVHNIQLGKLPNAIIETGFYGFGLGCVFHEQRDISLKCSKARILQWMSNICQHVCDFNGIQIIPGRHTALQLFDGSRMGFFEN